MNNLLFNEKALKWVSALWFAIFPSFGGVAPEWSAF